MNSATTHHPLPPVATPAAAMLSAVARILARAAAALRRAAAGRRRAAACDPHVGERAALGDLSTHVLKDIGASPALVAYASGRRDRDAAERILSGLY